MVRGNQKENIQFSEFPYFETNPHVLTLFHISPTGSFFEGTNLFLVVFRGRQIFMRVGLGLGGGVQIQIQSTKPPTTGYLRVT